MKTLQQLLTTWDTTTLQKAIDDTRARIADRKRDYPLACNETMETKRWDTKLEAYLTEMKTR